MFLVACQPAIQPLPEHIFRLMMDFEIAQDIADKCPTYRVNTTRKDVHMQIDESLIALGYSPQEIVQLKKRSSVGWGEKYKIAYRNVVPIARDDLSYWCQYGEFEQGRRSAIGQLLTATHIYHKSIL